MSLRMRIAPRLGAGASLRFAQGRLRRFAQGRPGPPLADSGNGSAVKRPWRSKNNSGRDARAPRPTHRLARLKAWTTTRLRGNCLRATPGSGRKGKGAVAIRERSAGRPGRGIVRALTISPAGPGQACRQDVILAKRRISFCLVFNRNDQMLRCAQHDVRFLQRSVKCERSPGNGLRRAVENR